MVAHFNILFLGDSTTWSKTSLIIRIVNDTFRENYLTTIGIDKKEKIIQNQYGNKIALLLYDTAGQERFRSIHQNLIKGSHCIILGYDITKRNSFESIKSYHYNNASSIKGDSALIYLVGNKTDLPNKREEPLQKKKILNFLKFLQKQEKELIIY